jgi:phospholipase/lecithinase/hemolysin
LKVRHDIVVKLMDSLNAMLKGLAAPPDILHVDLTGTLQTRNDWANELHPTNAGFRALADKIHAALQANI